MLSERVDSAQLKELARQGASMALRVPVSKSSRLLSCTDRAGSGDNSAGLAATVQFDIGPEGFPRVGLSITGQLSLECQRCLGPVQWPVRIETQLSVLENDEQTELLASPFDSVLVNANGLDLVAILEDEILAALPMAPMHGDESQCKPAGGDDDNSAIDAELMQRPFADLASLVASRKSDADG